ncbi:MAG: IgGFc-binding protein [Myxococcales bacterium]|nr:IgGFc-binding protein [Myxococcales bacterium]
MVRVRSARSALGLGLSTLLAATALVATARGLAACSFDPAYRDTPDARAGCVEGAVACEGGRLLVCAGGTFATRDDCGARGLVCSGRLGACAACDPGTARCQGADVLTCDANGATETRAETCDASKKLACRRGGCVDLCREAEQIRSNVGCEYWAVDLDNAVVSSGSAAAQQFAVVVSNPQPDLPAKIVIEEDTAKPGEPPRVRVIATGTVTPRNLETFKLGPKEVDGSPEGTFDTGPGTALTRGGFKITSDVPIVAYQFNPLENVNVFSNDASQLLPVAALTGSAQGGYVIAGWPQTIAKSENPATNFGTDLRAFLAVVATRPDTRVTVKTTARIVSGGPSLLPAGVPAGGSVELTLQPFEVLNLETGDFNADFTGTVVTSDKPVVAFPGSEASDSPSFTSLAERQCCADHLEEQAVPTRAVGKRYVLGRVPNRSRAVAAAGGAVGPFNEPEYYRVVAVNPGKTKVKTTLGAPYAELELDGVGANVTIIATRDGVLEADGPVIVADVQVSQDGAGVPRGLPGGDPSLTFLPPIEQWRSDYVLLTPDKYAFDFLVITAPRAAQVFLDGAPVSAATCEVGGTDGKGVATSAFLVYRCQLSFPTIDPEARPPDNVRPGRQSDGVHRVQADYPVGVLVYGFDSYVSYAYAGGTDLSEINVR